ncbi:MAG: SGNH/GDSL hydrolase family protein [Pseudomonadota bacterium]
MFPVYVWQGIGVRMRIERLKPAALPVEGEISGNDDPIRLLVIGDSTVASVGVQELDGTFAYAMANALHERTGRAIIWRSAGANSASSGDLERHVLPHIEPRNFTHVLVSVGTNDMKNFHLISRFKREFGALLYGLGTRFPRARILWTTIPDMRKFPALPKQLGRVLAARAELIN